MNEKNSSTQFMFLNVYMILSTGDDFVISCSVQTYTEPSATQWLLNDVTTEYMNHVNTEMSYDGTILYTTLTVTDMSDRDYGLYKCTVNTTFG